MLLNHIRILLMQETSRPLVNVFLLRQFMTMKPMVLLAKPKRLVPSFIEK